MARIPLTSRDAAAPIGSARDGGTIPSSQLAFHPAYRTIDYVKRRQTQVTARRIPRWAAGLLSDFAAERPPVVSLRDIAERLRRVELHRDPAVVVEELQRLGWLRPTGVRGAWAFLPPGEDEPTDPYLNLRSLHATQPERDFYLSGDIAAFHLGLLDRRPGSLQLWLPDNAPSLPHRLRTTVSTVTLPFPDEPELLLPSAAQFRRRRLDRLRWASGFNAFGPDALLAQLACRPSSFTSWFDLVSHLDAFTVDVETDRIARLLQASPKSAWQRAAHILDAAGQVNEAQDLFRQRPAGPLAVTHLGRRMATSPNTRRWSTKYQVIDSLVRPLIDVVGKA